MNLRSNRVSEKRVIGLAVEKEKIKRRKGRKENTAMRTSFIQRGSPCYSKAVAFAK
jgi:hypothetical protein